MRLRQSFLLSRTNSNRPELSHERFQQIDYDEKVHLCTDRRQETLYNADVAVCIACIKKQDVLPNTYQQKWHKMRMRDVITRLLVPVLLKILLALLLAEDELSTTDDILGRSCSEMVTSVLWWYMLCIFAMQPRVSRPWIKWEGVRTKRSPRNDVSLESPSLRISSGNVW